MNAPESAVAVNPDTQRGIYPKYNVSRVDGSDAPGERNHGHMHFVLDLDKLATDAHAKSAIVAYIESCEEEFPLLAEDLRGYVDRMQPVAFISVPEVTLPNGVVVPSFSVGQHLCSQSPDGTPWVEVSYHNARKACERAGTKLITELQALAIAHEIAQQDINWTGGKVGEGNIFIGIHKGNVGEVQPAAYISPDEEERRWHQLSNGECIYDFAGHCFTWVFDDVQGNADGIVDRVIAADSPSLTTAPFPSREKGTGWRPQAGANWSGSALIRGGCWHSGRHAGVFYLGYVWPDREFDNIGFRCTK
ncbi:MAG: hypothetical protein JWN23_624 [Rhodocyclales bacterium]|nr:hypothetical protein [Rhodocyclales bacterium]